MTPARDSRGAARTPSAIERLRRDGALILLLAYPPLGIAGTLLHHPPLSLASLLALLLALALLMLHRRRPLACALWLVLAVPMLTAVADGHADLALTAVPILANTAVAWLFGHTLVHGRQPLVARMIRIIDGEARLDAPGIARYARQLTLFWTLLLTAQALWLLVLLLCMVPDGVLATLGLTSPWPLVQAHFVWYTHAGAWLVPLLAMLIEYPWRRWHLRHIPHSSARQFATRLVMCWPQLLRGAGPAP